ncbi:hypothetical protein ACGFZG_31815 [Streptomyces antibioticus]|uniref:hypothetical protein n=1 Tax=Streptomyces antibioticus TaxID=1890 RepID=UPI00371F0E97
MTNLREETTGDAARQQKNAPGNETGYGEKDAQNSSQLALAAGGFNSPSALSSPAGVTAPGVQRPVMSSGGHSTTPAPAPTTAPVETAGRPATTATTATTPATATEPDAQIEEEQPTTTSRFDDLREELASSWPMNPAGPENLSTAHNIVRTHQALLPFVPEEQPSFDAMDAGHLAVYKVASELQATNGDTASAEELSRRLAEGRPKPERGFLPGGSGRGESGFPDTQGAGSSSGTRTASVATTSSDLTARRLPAPPTQQSEPAQPAQPTQQAQPATAARRATEAGPAGVSPAVAATTGETSRPGGRPTGPRGPRREHTVPATATAAPDTVVRDMAQPRSRRLPTTPSAPRPNPGAPDTTPLTRGSDPASRDRAVVRTVTVDGTQHEVLRVEGDGDCFPTSVLAGIARQIPDSDLRRLTVRQLRDHVADWLTGDSPGAVAQRAGLDSGPVAVRALVNDLTLSDLRRLLGRSAPADPTAEEAAAELDRIDSDLTRPQFARALAAQFADPADQAVVREFTTGVAAQLLPGFTPDRSLIRPQDRQRVLAEHRLARFRDAAAMEIARGNQDLYEGLLARYPSLLKAFPKIGDIIQLPMSDIVAHAIRHTDMWTSPFYDRMPEITAAALDMDIITVQAPDDDDPAAFAMHLNPAASRSLHVFYQDGNHYSAMNRVGDPSFVAPTLVPPSLGDPSFDDPVPVTPILFRPTESPETERAPAAPWTAPVRPELAALASFLRANDAGDGLIARLDGLSPQAVDQLNRMLPRASTAAPAGTRNGTGAPHRPARQRPAPLSAPRPAPQPAPAPAPRPAPVRPQDDDAVPAPTRQESRPLVELAAPEPVLVRFDERSAEVGDEQRWQLDTLAELIAEQALGNHLAGLPLPVIRVAAAPAQKRSPFALPGIGGRDLAGPRTETTERHLRQRLSTLLDDKQSSRQAHRITGADFLIRNTPGTGAPRTPNSVSVTVEFSPQPTPAQRALTAQTLGRDWAGLAGATNPGRRAALALAVTIVGAHQRISGFRAEDDPDFDALPLGHRAVYAVAMDLVTHRGDPDHADRLARQLAAHQPPPTLRTDTAPVKPFLLAPATATVTSGSTVSGGSVHVAQPATVPATPASAPGQGQAPPVRPAGAARLVSDLLGADRARREAALAAMSPEHRAWLTADAALVDTLSTTLPPREFARLAARLMVDVPEGVHRPVSARGVAHDLVARTLRNPAVAAALLKRGVHVVVLPKDVPLTDLPEMSALAGKSADGGRALDGVRGIVRGETVVINEENLLGESTDIGEGVQHDGYATTTHEMAHAIKLYALDRADVDLIDAAYRARLAMGPDAPWPNGIRRDLAGTPRENYSSSNVEEYWAELTNTYLGVHPGRDFLTHRWGMNGADWVAQHEPGLMPLLERLYGPPDEARIDGPVNPVDAVRAEEEAYDGIRALFAGDPTAPADPRSREALRPPAADDLVRDLPRMNARERADALDMLAPEHRRWLSLHHGLVDTLKSALPPTEFAATAAQLMTDVPDGAAYPTETPRRWRGVFAALLQDPEVAARMLTTGAQLVVLPVTAQLTDLPRFQRLRGGTFDDGSNADDARSAFDGTLFVLPEEYLTGGPGATPAGAAGEGLASAVHELAAEVLRMGLDDDDLHLVQVSYDRRREAGPDASWPDGIRRNLAGTPTDNLSSQDIRLYFSQLTTVYLGLNQGTDPFTGRPRENGAAWVAAHEPVLMPLLERLYGPVGTPASLGAAGPQGPAEQPGAAPLPPPGADTLVRDLPLMEADERLDVIAALSPGHRRWLARHTELVDGLKRALSPEEFADTAARLMVDVPDGATHPDRTSALWRGLFATMLRDPDVTARLLTSGTHLVVLPEHGELTDLSQFAVLGGRTLPDGTPLSSLRAASAGSTFVLPEEYLPGADPAEGVAAATHGLASPLYRNGLDEADRGTLEASFQARRDLGPDAPWPDGIRRDLSGAPVDNLSSQSAAAYFAQLTNTYLGTNAGHDADTGRPRANGADWIAAHEPGLLPLLTRLYGPPPQSPFTVDTTPWQADDAASDRSSSVDGSVDSSWSTAEVHDLPPFPAPPTGGTVFSSAGTRSTHQTTGMAPAAPTPVAHALHAPAADVPSVDGTAPAQALTDTDAQGRTRILAGLSDEERAELAADTGAVQALRAALAPDEFAEVAAWLLVDVPDGVRQPVSARQAAHRLVARMLRDPEAAARLLTGGSRVVVVPRDTPMTELRPFKALEGKQLGGGRVWDHVRGSGGKNTAITEENLLGESSTLPNSAYDDGYSTTVHELAHTIHLQGLSDADRLLIDESFTARKALRASASWPDGPRLGPSNKVTENYSSQNPYEYFAQLSNVYFGVNTGTDPFTGRARENGSAWVEQHEPRLLPLLERLYGPAPQPGELGPVNPVLTVREENETLAAVTALFADEPLAERPQGNQQLTHLEPTPGTPVEKLTQWSGPLSEAQEREVRTMVRTLINSARLSAARIVLERLVHRAERLADTRYGPAAEHLKYDVGQELSRAADGNHLTSTPQTINFFWIGREMSPAAVDNVLKWAALAAQHGWTVQMWTDTTPVDPTAPNVLRTVWDRDAARAMEKAGVRFRAVRGMLPLDRPASRTHGKHTPGFVLENPRMKKLRTLYDNARLHPKAFPIASDVVRVGIMLYEGGAYLDVDMAPGGVELFSTPRKMGQTDMPLIGPMFRDAESFARQRAALADLIGGSPDAISMEILASYSMRQARFGNAFMMTVPGSTFFERLIDDINDEALGWDPAELAATGAFLTGPLLYHRAAAAQVASYGLGDVTESEIGAAMDPFELGRWAKLGWLTEESESQVDKAGGGTAPRPSGSNKHGLGRGPRNRRGAGSKAKRTSREPGTTFPPPPAPSTAADAEILPAPAPPRSGTTTATVTVTAVAGTAVAGTAVAGGTVHVAQAPAGSTSQTASAPAAPATDVHVRFQTAWSVRDLAARGELSWLSTERRTEIATDRVLVSDLKALLDPREFTRLAVQLMVDVPEGVQRPASARQEAHALAELMLRDPDVTERLLVAGVRVVVLPKDAALTSLPAYHRFHGDHLHDGRAVDSLRGATLDTTVVISEENLLGENPELPGTAAQEDGYSSAVHEIAHAIQNHGLSPADADLVRATYQARLSDPGASWPDGPRHDTQGNPKDNYSSTNHKEFFAQLSNTYLGVNLGNDITTGQQRENSADWVVANLPGLLPLLERLYGPPEDAWIEREVNPWVTTQVTEEGLEGVRAVFAADEPGRLIDAEPASNDAHTKATYTVEPDDESIAETVQAERERQPVADPVAVRFARSSRTVDAAQDRQLRDLARRLARQAVSDREQGLTPQPVRIRGRGNSSGHAAFTGRIRAKNTARVLEQHVAVELRALQGTHPDPVVVDDLDIRYGYEDTSDQDRMDPHDRRTAIVSFGAGSGPAGMTWTPLREPGRRDRHELAETPLTVTFGKGDKGVSAADSRRIEDLAERIAVRALRNRRLGLKPPTIRVTGRGNGPRAEATGTLRAHNTGAELEQLLARKLRELQPDAVAPLTVDDFPLSNEYDDAPKELYQDPLTHRTATITLDWTDQSAETNDPRNKPLPPVPSSRTVGYVRGTDPDTLHAPDGTELELRPSVGPGTGLTEAVMHLVRDEVDPDAGWYLPDGTPDPAVAAFHRAALAEAVTEEDLPDPFPVITQDTLRVTEADGGVVHVEPSELTPLQLTRLLLMRPETWNPALDHIAAAGLARRLRLDLTVVDLHSGTEWRIPGGGTRGVIVLADGRYRAAVPTTASTDQPITQS